ncbi:glutamate--tRNA ligase [Lentzea sp. NPDC059081]|uniref:glutamate--tRNA ligase n=1 Tax=Lentzea sp. NPDC059081 TaxID=3346719 RepID=UPI00368D7228
MRTVFAPSPIGPPSLGLIRTAIFGWALARRHGGTFVLRIEDTDQGRVREDYYRALLDVLRWLGLDWDEGPEVGGPHGPYVQSERRELHLEVARKLFEAGELYESFSTPEEAARRREQRGDRVGAKYDNADRDLTEAQKAAFRAEGRKPLLRLRLPDGETVFDDLVHGRTVFKDGGSADPVAVRSNGQPTFVLANPIDDALMGITHSLRGEGALSSVPRQVAAYAALQRIGVASHIPRFGHLAPVLDASGKPLDRTMPEADVLAHRDRGVVPQAMFNFLASIGWSHPRRGDHFSAAELAEAFEPARVKSRPAKLDLGRLASFNVKHLRALDRDEFIALLRPHLDTARASAEVMPPHQRDLLERVAPLVQARSRSLVEAAEAIACLFEPGEVVASRCGQDTDREALAAVADLLEDVEDWTVPGLETRLRSGLDETPELKRRAYAALRLAITGRPVNPMLFEVLGLLGRADSLARVRLALGGAEVAAGNARAAG